MNNELTLTEVLQHGEIERHGSEATVYLLGKKDTTIPRVTGIDCIGKDDFKILEEALLTHLDYENDETEL